MIEKKIEEVKIKDWVLNQQKLEVILEGKTPISIPGFNSVRKALCPQ